MISSRWPRPIGISASIALRPVCIGSCTERRGMMPGALTSTRRRSVALDRALAVDRVAERVDDAAEEALADRHVDDGAGPLDRVAFLDVAVVAEDDDADIVALEVERHAADAAGELDHLAGLDVVEAVDAGDAVADREHLADFGDFRLLAEILDLLLEDRGDFCGPDIHQPTSFMASFSELSLVRSDPSIMRLPTLTMRPPISAGSTLRRRAPRPCRARPSAPPSGRRDAFADSGSALVTSAETSPRCLASSAPEGGDDLGNGEEPPVARRRP